MAELELHTDTCRSGLDRARQLQPQLVKQRIDALPPFDTAQRMDGLSSLLADANQAELSVDTQLALFNLVEPQVQDLISGYQEQMHHYAFPLSAKRHSIYLSLQTLLAHAASAYKRLTLDLLKHDNSESHQLTLRGSIMRCIDYLTQQALQAYSVYQDAPSFIWNDLHHLYAYAEKKQLATDVVEHLSDLSISGAYARALLLAIADPGHLLQGEIYQTYEKLRKWGLAVRFEHPQELPPGPLGDLIIDRYFCDLEGCAPPDFGIESTSALPQDPRLLNLKEVLRIIDGRMKSLKLEYRHSLLLHSEWDLLSRLRHAWEKRPLRKETRKTERGTTVKAIVSLSSCHYFFSGYQHFEPEKAEVHLHGDDFQQPQTLSLVASDSTPWLDTDTETKLETGVIKPRSYSFDAEQKENDVWKKSHSTAKHQDSEIEKNVEERMLETIYEFRLTNTSSGGEGLETIPDSRVQLHVGELLALFPHGGEGDGEPVLNVVRWIQADPDLKLHIGVHHIGGTSSPLAVRALGDDAIYKDYVRAFLVDDHQLSSIIVPAGQFECGTTLVVNDGEVLKLYRLETLVESTRAFSRFKFKPVEMDQQASDRIVGSLKALLRQETN